MAVADVFESEARDILKGLNVEEADPVLVGSLYTIIELTDIARKFEGNVNALLYKVEELEAENADLKRHCEWLEQNLNLKNTVVDDLKNKLRDAPELVARVRELERQAQVLAVAVSEYQRCKTCIVRRSCPNDAKGGPQEDCVVAILKWAEQAAKGGGGE